MNTQTEIAELAADVAKAAELYHNGDQSFLTDAEWDAKFERLKELDPVNPAIIGVGSSTRGDKTALPFVMGSLDQVKEGGTVAWITKENLGDEEIIQTDKLDGTSIMLVYAVNGNLQIAYSRGDGKFGADVTRHVTKIRQVPKKISQGMVVRAEVILPEHLFPMIQAAIQQETGQVLKNARNFVAGQMNSSNAHDLFYKHVVIVAYEIMHRQDAA